MFENLDPNDFRDEFTEEFGKLLSALKKNDDFRREHEALYFFLRDMNGHLFGESKAVQPILEAIAERLEKEALPELADCLQGIKSVLSNPRYESFFEEDNKKFPDVTENKQETLGSVAVSQMGHFAQPKQDRPLTLMEQFDDVHSDKAEIVQKLMAHERETNPNYNGTFIDLNDIEKKIDRSGLDDLTADEKRTVLLQRTRELLFQTINARVAECHEKGETRAQFIVRSGNHYTPIDINTKTESAVVMDAAQDMSRLRLLQLRGEHIRRAIDISMSGSEFKFQGETRTTKLQKDDYSCWQYALFHSFEMAKESRLHEDTLKHSQPHKIASTAVRTSWIHVKPQFVAVGQSTVLVSYYKANNDAKTAATMDELTNNNTKGHGKKVMGEVLRERYETVLANEAKQEKRAGGPGTPGNGGGGGGAGGGN